MTMMNDVGKRITDLTLTFHEYPFVGMLLRTWITDSSLEDVQVFEKALKLYKNQTSLMSKDEIERSFDIFAHIKRIERDDYMSLYKIITNGLD